MLPIRNGSDYGGTVKGERMAEKIRTKVRGVSHYQGACKKVRRGDRLVLLREPENRHDKNAIAVLSQSGKRVGYISAALAEELAPHMDRGNAVTCDVLQRTGGTADKRTVGINIELRVAGDLDCIDEMPGDTSDAPGCFEALEAFGALLKAIPGLLFFGFLLYLLFTCS